MHRILHAGLRLSPECAQCGGEPSKVLYNEHNATNVNKSNNYDIPWRRSKKPRGVQTRCETLRVDWMQVCIDCSRICYAKTVTIGLLQCSDGLLIVSLHARNLK
jgi:hypothetical protein